MPDEASPHLVGHLEHKTNDWVRSKISFLVGPQEPLLATAKRLRLAWFGHVALHDNISKTIIQGTLKGGRCNGGQGKCLVDNIKEWISLPIPDLLTMASRRKKMQENISSIVPHVPPTTKSVKGLN